jgi:4-amino-4-deoxy-L-arabinose transferase-like glycosyltransferase
MSIADASSMPLAARRVAILVLMAAASTLFFSRLQSPLLEPEEALYAEVPREMSVAESWLVPIRHGQAYYEKPPLLYWLIMTGYAVFGVHEWVARLVPCVAALGTVLLVFWWGRRMFGFRAGLAGALVLSLSPRYLHQARMITMDGLLCFWVVSALALGQQAMQASRLRWRGWLLSAAACGLGILTKGPVALILAVPPLFAYQVLDRRSARPGIRDWLAYLGTAAGLAMPWFVAVIWQDPGFLREFFWTHHVVMRFVQPLHDEPAWFYIPVLVLGMLPWTFLLPGLIRLGCRKCEAASFEVRFLLVTCLWCLVFFSAADCKRIGYILPAMPTLALALGYALDRRLEGGTMLPFWATQSVFAVGIAGALVAVHIDLLETGPCIILIALACAGMAWTFSRRQPPLTAWATCGVASFVLLFLAVQFLLPNYFHRFSMRDQIRSVMDRSYHPQLPIACYPHHWDSIGFYFQREDVGSYSRERREKLIAELERQPETLVFVKTGRALNDLLHSLSPSLEFVPRGQSRTVTAGLVRQRAR